VKDLEENDLENEGPLFIYLFIYLFIFYFIFCAQGTQFPRAVNIEKENETCLERSRCGLRNWERVC